MIYGSIEKIEQLDAGVTISVVIFEPPSVYFEEDTEEYKEAVEAYQQRIAEYRRLHLGRCQLEQEIVK